MKKGLAVAATLSILMAVLSGSFVQAAGPGPGPSGETTIVRVYYPDLATGNKVLISFNAQLLETDYGEGYHVMEVNQDEIDLLTRAGLRVQVDDAWKPEHLLEGATLLQDVTTGIPRYPCYRTVEETFATAQQIVSEHPTLAEWIDAGDSWEKWADLGGFDMRVLRLTNRDIIGDKPKLFLTGAMHAREYATAELVTRFGEYLVDNYGSDADVTWILDHHEVHLMLQTNPDGRKQAETGLSWRKNTNQNYCGPTSEDRGADLNRNFEFNWACCGGSSDDECSQTYHGPFAASEPELQAVQGHMASIFPDQRVDDPTTPAPDDATGIYIDVHAYGRLVLWPWGSTAEPPPNATQLQTLGRKFAYWNDYSPEQAIGLYPTDGTSDEHAYGTLGVAAYCFEVGTSFFQSCSYFENTLVPANLPSLLYASKVVRTPYLTPSGPDVLDLLPSTDPVPAGAQVTLSGTIDDTRYNNSNGTEPVQNVSAAEYYVDTPPWAGGPPSSMSATDGSFDSAVEAVQALVDTNGWSEGRHILLVRGRDADGNWGAFSATFLTIGAATGTMHVGDLDGSSTAAGRNRWNATVTITVHDGSHNPLADATVTGSWSGGTIESASCSTGIDGQCSLSAEDLNGKKVTFTVTGLSHATSSYQPGENHDLDGDSDGTSIAVLKP